MHDRSKDAVVKKSSRDALCIKSEIEPREARWEARYGTDLSEDAERVNRKRVLIAMTIFISYSYPQQQTAPTTRA